MISLLLKEKNKNISIKTKQRKLMLSKDELQIFCKTIGIDLSSDKQIYNGTVIYVISGCCGT